MVTIHKFFKIQLLLESYSYYNEKVIEENSKSFVLPICMNLTSLWKEVVGIGY